MMIQMMFYSFNTVNLFIGENKQQFWGVAKQAFKTVNVCRVLNVRWTFSADRSEA